LLADGRWRVDGTWLTVDSRTHTPPQTDNRRPSTANFLRGPIELPIFARGVSARHSHHLVWAAKKYFGDSGALPNSPATKVSIFFRFTMQHEGD
jgi:hypothetical protein